MNPILRNILALVVGYIVGSIVNMSLIIIGLLLMPVPGVELFDFEAYAEAAPSLEFRHFIFPFLAHALGTMVGALVAGRMAASRKMIMSMIIGVAFLIGGIQAVNTIPAPTWFTALDLVVAYIPMAWLGGRLAQKKN